MPLLNMTNGTYWAYWTERCYRTNWSYRRNWTYGTYKLCCSAYLVTFNDDTSSDGIPVPADERLPIDHLELDISDIITLDTNEETIQFNVEGYYKITFTVSAYAQQSNTEFDPTKDFVSLGFRLVDSDSLFIGASQWTYYDEATQIVGQGIIAVENIANAYELVNLSP